MDSATWSPGGRLDWWSKSASSGSAGYEARTAGNDGSKLLIFVPGAAHSRDLRGWLLG